MGTEGSSTAGRPSISSLVEQTDEDADEVFLLMHGDIRVSRNVRAKWFFDHIGKHVKLSDNFNSHDGITVVGMLPKIVTDRPECPSPTLRVSKNTTLTYFSNCYRFVFVLDLSPSAFAADESGEICYLRIFESVVICLQNVVKSFKFPGGLVMFRPQIYATFCAFSPFLCFTEDSVLLQGVHVTEENVRVVITNLRHKFNQYINNLCTYFQPFIRDWAAQRRKFRSFARDVEVALYADSHYSSSRLPPKIGNVDKFISDFRLQISDTRCSGFVQPDWSLISMLRMGLLGIQMLQENAQSHLLIATDGCCAIPNEDALEQMITQLRSYTVTCSFIQTDSSNRGAALGHVSFPELFNFLSTATFGKFMYTSELIDVETGLMNTYHRSLLSWNFQRACGPEIAPLMPDFIQPKMTRTIKTRQFYHYYKTSVYKLLYVRLREGYTIKDIDHFVLDNKDMIKLYLTLLWKPDTTIEYVISAPWRKNFQRVSRIFVELFVETATIPLRFPQVQTEEMENPMQTIENLVEVDNLLIQMHMFNSNPAYYKLPRNLIQKIPLFEMKGGEIFVNDRFNKPKYQQFAQFWLPVCIINESMWQRWVHMQTLRVLITEDDPLPKRIFTKSVNNNTFDQIQCRDAGRQLLELLTQKSTFVLLSDQCFVNILFTRDQPTPQYFYVLRVIYDSPCMIIKIAFLGGMSATKRNQIIKSIREDITALSMRRTTANYVQLQEPLSAERKRRRKSQSSVHRQSNQSLVRVARLFQRPMERILVRYSRVPLDVASIIRLENTANENEIREMIMHNAVTKYLSCRRMVWELKPTFPRLHATPTATMEFILQLIIKRRLKQGFSIAYGENGIVNLIRQVNSHSRSGTQLSRVEQCVIFGPVMTDTDLPPAGQFDTVDEIANYIDILRREAELRVRPKSWPRLATEVWLEPQDHIDQNVCSDEESNSERMPHIDFEETTRKQLLKEADTIIRSIFTFDQFMRAAESGMHAEEAHVLNKVSSVMTRESLSGAVDSYKDVFDPKSLMDNADTRAFMLLPGLGYSETESSIHVDARLESLLKYVQAELMKYCDCCVDALDDAFLWDIVETCEEHFGINRFFSPDNAAVDDPQSGTQSQPSLLNNRLVQDSPQRNLQRKRNFSNGSSAESERSNASYSTTNNRMSGGPNSPVSEFVFDEDSQLMIGSKPFDSPLSRSMTAFGAENDPFSVAADAASAALSGLQAELENIHQRATSIPGNASSDSEDNFTFDEFTIQTNDTPYDSQSTTNPQNATSTAAASFITPDLLNAFDQAIAFSSSSLSGLTGKTSNSPPANSPTIRAEGTKKERRINSTTDEEQSVTTTDDKSKKMAGDRSRNPSGVNKTEKKTSREDERQRHDSDSPGPKTDEEAFHFDRTSRPQHFDWQAKEEERAEAIKKFPPIPLGGFGVYVRRLNSHRLILYFVPKNAKTVRLLMPHVTNAFPVFSYYVDKLRMSQNFVEFGGSNTGPHRRIRTIVEDYTQKAHMSTLAHLNQQLHDRLVQECTKMDDMDGEEVPLDEFFLRALDSSLRAPLEPTNFQLTTFDLRSYSERVFEEYIFTKAFIAATFSSLGQSVAIPMEVLREATEIRCDHVSLELGSIHSIIQSCCLHLQAYEQLPNSLTSSSAALDPLTLSPIPQPAVIRPLSPRRFFRFANGCLSSSDSWTDTFRKLLQLHSFKPVPGLPDYYFFWPYRKAVLRFANVDDVSTEFADVFRAIGDHPTFAINDNDDEARRRSESGSRILAEAGNATQLSPSDICPLFIQMNVGVLSPDGQMETSPISNIPNCLRQLADRCSTRVLQLETEGLTGQSMRVAVDLYVLTWPLPSQCPFRVVDPHLVYARYQETQSQLALLQRNPDRRRRWFLEVSRRENKRKRRKLSSSNTTTSTNSSPTVVNESIHSDEEAEKEGSSEEEEEEKPFRRLHLQSSDSSDTETDNEAEDSNMFSMENDQLENLKRAEQERQFISEIRNVKPSKRTADFLAQLPRVEHYAIKRLQLAIKRLISSELVFNWSRECEHLSPQPSRRLIDTTCRFITRIAQPNDNQLISSSVCTEAIFNSCIRTVVLTGDAINGISRLCERLEGAKIDYVRLRRFNPRDLCVDDSVMDDEIRFVDGRSNFDDEEETEGHFKSRTRGERTSDSPIFFYACGVDDVPNFDDYFISSQLNAAGPQEPFREPPTITPPSSYHHVHSPAVQVHTIGLSTSPATSTITAKSMDSPIKKMSTSGLPVNTPSTDRRRRRASSCGPAFDKKLYGVSDSSSELSEASESETAYDTIFTLNDATRQQNDDSEASRRVLPIEKRGKLQRQLSTRYASTDSIHASSSADEMETTTSSTRSGRSTPKSLDFESIVGSSGTWIAGDQVVSGQDAPNGPIERTRRLSDESVRSTEMRSGFPLNWLVACGVYSGEESLYAQKREPHLHDFWLIFKLEHSDVISNVTVYFIRRSDSPHKMLVRSALRVLDEQIRIVNQQLLLDTMQKTEECDQLLIDNPDSSSEPKPIHRPMTFYKTDKSGRRKAFEIPCADESERYRQEATTHLSEEEPQSNDSDLLQSARFKFPPGHFACDAVWFHWFQIHPRLQPHARYLSGSVDTGFRTLQLALERFAVKNRQNLYVFREQKVDNVVYLRLYANEPETFRVFTLPPYTQSPSMPANSRPHSHVLLAVHGVEKPSDEITDLLRKMLERRLDTRTLTEIQDLLLKNAQARLDVSDARFIQKDSISPTATFFYTIPPSINGLLRPLIYYFEQQALAFSIVPHFREHTGNQTSGTTNQKCSTYGQSGLSHCYHHPATAFVSHTPTGLPENPDGYVPLFFLLNRPPTEGRRDIGLACIEAKILDPELQPISKTSSTTSNLSHSTRQVLLYPSRPKANARERLDKWLSQTKTRRVKVPTSQSEAPNNSAYLQLSVWENGKVDMNEVADRFRLCLQQAICDVYTEFGLLSMPILENSPAPQLLTQPSLPSVESAPANIHQNLKSPSRPIQSVSVVPATSTPTLQSQSNNELHTLTSWSDPPITLDDAFLSRAAAAVSDNFNLHGSNSSLNASTITATSSTGDLDSFTTTSSQAVFPCHQHEDRLPVAKSGRQSSGSGIFRTTKTAEEFRPGRLSSVGAQPSQSLFTAAAAAISSRANAVKRGPSQPPQPTTPTKTTSPPFMSANNSRTSLTSTTSIGRLSSGVNPQSPTTLMNTAEWLRPDFARTAADWLDFVATTARSPETSNLPSVVRRFVFEIENENTVRRVLHIIHEQLRQTYSTERVVFCRGSTPTPGGHTTEFSFAGGGQTTGRRLQALHSATSLLEPFERDIGRVVSDREMNSNTETEEDIDSNALITIADDDEESEVELAVLAFNEREFLDSISRIGYPQPRGRTSTLLSESLLNLCTPASRESQLQFYPPFKEPYIPRQRLLFLVVRGRESAITLFLYNYAPEVCETTRDLVQRTVLWHNARSRLLRDIGVQKLGVTHLIPQPDFDLERNPYLLLTCMEPEALIRHELPPEDLKMPDFSRVPRKYAQLFFKLYRFAEPAFVAKNFSTDPFEDQTQQMLTLREDIKAKLNDHRLFQEVHQHLLQGKATLHEEVLHRITARSHHAHYVQSPLLLFTSWRCRIAAIRQNLSSIIDAAGTQADGGHRLNVNEKRTSTDGPPSPIRPALNRFVLTKPTARTAPTTAILSVPNQTSKGRSKTLNIAPVVPTLKQYMKRPAASVVREPSPSTTNGSRSSSGIGFRTIEQELCLLKVQYMLVADYVEYLQTIGLKLLSIRSANSHSTSYNLNYTPECTEPPHVWLYAARQGGIIFANVTFVEPYFSVRFLFWNASQLNDNLYPLKTISSDALEEMREVELLKNDLIQRCHVHSFTYDFHLRMVSTYLTGGSQVLFNPGYNTHAFLIDFLRYYNQRPPYSRDCVYEERAVFQPLRVSGHTVWDYFLSNDQHFGWNVVRIKMMNNTETDEFMLISKETREISGHSYQLICVVLNDMKPSSLQENKIELKLYVLMVSDDIKFPLPDNTNLSSTASTRPRLESGKFSRFNPTPEVNFVMSPVLPPKPMTKQSGDSSNSSGGSEYTRVDCAQSPNHPLASDNKTGNSNSGGHISRLDSHNQTLEEQDLPALDQLIAMSTDELMYDVGLLNSSSACSTPPDNKSAEESNSKSSSDSIASPILLASSPQNSDPLDFRRRCTSGDSAQKGQLLLIKPIGDELTTSKPAIRSEKHLSGGTASNVRSASSDARSKFAKTGRRNSEIPMSGRQLSGSLTRLDFHNALDDVWRSPPATDNQTNTENVEDSSAGFSIQKVPLRRHRQPFIDYVMKRNTDVVLAHEQVTYVHYQSSQQVRLQHLLEETSKIKKSELETFVYEAEKNCYVNALWTSLLSAKSGIGRQQKHSTTLFSSTPSTKHDSGGEGTSRIPLTEMEPTDFDNLLASIRTESLAEEEPRLVELLCDVNFHQLCRYLFQHYENDKMYRYFERPTANYLIILNPSYLDSAMLLRSGPNSVGVELFIAFKEIDTDRWKKHAFNSNAVHKQFEELVHHLTTFVWLDLVQRTPAFK
ncbi:Protein SZT2 [Aphelenchoides besseyi]|nr:Protein SZT2 [Aphelenchoides besseyi]